MAWYMIEARASDGDWLAIDSTFEYETAERLMNDDYMALVTRIVKHTDGLSSVVSSHIPEGEDSTNMVPVMAIDGWPLYRARDY